MLAEKGNPSLRETQAWLLGFPLSDFSVRPRTVAATQLSEFETASPKGQGAKIHNALLLPSQWQPD